MCIDHIVVIGDPELIKDSRYVMNIVDIEPVGKKVMQDVSMRKANLETNLDFTDVDELDIDHMSGRNSNGVVCSSIIDKLERLN